MLADGRRRCARCRFDWRPGRWPLRLTPRQWRAVLRWFVRGAASADIARETGLERKRVLRALTVVRLAIHGRAGPTEPRRGPLTLGLYVAQGREWADIVAPSGSDELRQALRGGGPLDRLLSRRFERYAAVVYRGRLYRLPVRAGAPPLPFGRLEAFWAYLQRQLRAKGGIRQERFGLYLAEYVWRYHHRSLPPEDQARRLAALIRRYRVEGKE